MKKALKQLGLGAMAVVAAGSAMAQTAPSAVDVSSVVSTLGTGLAAIGLIGVAVLGLAAVVAIYNWVRKPIK
ncbi:hypothetical protein LMG7143_01107 [Ralstonia thomasii]|uniref:major capsid protein n=1 Tax=Ralstonia thomasii TaxID=3058596 RepID=UPI0028F596C5|nr:major capsid protein [Ralstonia sp. LMG 18095]CAJ0709532.1 hypothetical protein LMG7143_01107 [Ralstonia sp. LMG 18095]